MNRADFQTLADLRAREATILLDAGCPEGAYYLVGYAVECALKACIAKQTSIHDFPPHPDLVRKMYSHKVGELLESARLDGLLKDNAKADPMLAVYWTVVKDWSEQKRYERPSEKQARELHRAVVDPDHGVLQWIRKHW